MYFQKEYDELREFTTLEKQICNPKVCNVLNYTKDISF
jgi:hypothetical protein